MSRPRDGKELSVLVHEVRSPVAALAAIAETFADASIAGTDRAELARLALGASRALEQIAVDAVAASVRHESVDVAALVRDVAATWALAGSHVESAVATTLPTVSGDPVRLRQALDNLVSNALVHSGADAMVVVGASSSEEHVVLTVSDSGVGIPEEDQERIFDAGERLDSSRPGSGIGLAVVRAIVEAHGGRLSVSSSPGEGATFTIALRAS